ncbi:hypothetical protein P280DRAFT_523446 [Massarina eburnea CBS 473.64]|uniref:Uncharacterized protein n=1 Tax=Massarina eburnea CBS 473.64 TaxID=1395130 RepID=A0A6A6RIT4_9PLEO|nr:hypothetical protein P280DRAFT_523446 [Massarina eburnea CBS 473.64]
MRFHIRCRTPSDFFENMPVARHVDILDDLRTSITSYISHSATLVAKFDRKHHAVVYFDYLFRWYEILNSFLIDLPTATDRQYLDFIDNGFGTIMDAMLMDSNMILKTNWRVTYDFRQNNVPSDAEIYSHVESRCRRQGARIEAGEMDVMLGATMKALDQSVYPQSWSRNEWLRYMALEM